MSAGFRNMIFWVGRVIAREDGQGNGRVKVRVFGIHSDNPDDVSETDLPWAPVVNGTYGTVGAVPALGTWVFGGFMDGEEGQHPIVLGSIPGYAGQLPEASGEEGGVEGGDAAHIESLDSAPLHPALGGENADTLSGPILAAAFRNDARPTSTGATVAETSYIMPERNLDNRVLASLDNQNYVVLGSGTDGVTQITTASGSVVQIDGTGNVYIKATNAMDIVADQTRFDRVENGSMMTSINGGDWLLRVDGGNGRVYMQGDLDMEVENFNLTVRGDYNVNVGRTYNTRAADIKLFSYVNDVNIVAQQHFKTQSILETSIQSETSLYLYSNLNTTSNAGWYRWTAALGSWDVTTLTGIYHTSTTSKIDFLSLTGINLSTPATINIGGGPTTLVNIDKFINLAGGVATSPLISTPATLAIPARLLGIQAAAVGLPDAPASEPAVGYKAFAVDPSRRPAASTARQDPIDTQGKVENAVDTLRNILQV